MNDRTTRWIVLALFVFLYVPFLYNYGYRKAFMPVGDFPSIYWGAKYAFVERRSPYVESAFAEVQSLLRQRVFPYLYPPPSLVAFYPLTFFSYDAAKLLLLAASHVCILLFIYLFFFKIKPFDLQPPARELMLALAIVYLFSYHPVIDNLNWGQINLIILVLLCLAWHALKRGGHALSIALPLSAAILLKTYPVVLLPLLLMKRRFRAAACVIALLALYAVIAYLVLPRSVWGDWALNVLPRGGYGRAPVNLFLPVAPWNHSINGFGTFLFNRYPQTFGIPTRYLTWPLSYMLSAVVIVVTIGLSYLCARKGGETFDLQFSIFLLMMFLVAPLSWEHHLVFVLPSALIALRLLLFGGERRTVRLLFIASLFFLAWDFPREALFPLQGIWALTNLVKFYAVSTIWIFFVMKLWKRLPENWEFNLNASGT